MVTTVASGSLVLSIFTVCVRVRAASSLLVASELDKVEGKSSSKPLDN